MFDTIAGTLIVALGVFGLFSRIIATRQSHRSTRWPHVEGVIVSSNSTDDPIEGSILYTLDITYEYLVNGIRYQSEDHKAWTDKREARNNAADQFREGSQVFVYYDPDNPTVSLIKRGVGWNHVIGLFFAIILIAIGAFTIADGLGWI